LIFVINPGTSAELMFQMVENLLSPTLSSFLRQEERGLTITSNHAALEL
jgi:hypothetical protein